MYPIKFPYKTFSWSITCFKEAFFNYCYLIHKQILQLCCILCQWCFCRPKQATGFPKHISNLALFLPSFFLDREHRKFRLPKMNLFLKIFSCSCTLFSYTELVHLGIFMWIWDSSLGKSVWCIYHKETQISGRQFTYKQQNKLHT
jgi:hypothetical protein